jgi:hypothetical protein
MKIDVGTVVVRKVTVTLDDGRVVQLMGVTLDDGRVVQLMADGTLCVHEDGRNFANSYIVNLPTVAEVASACDENEDGEVKIVAYHQH